MTRVGIKLCGALIFATVLVLFLKTSEVDSARYTSRELEELRKFYYDDVDDNSKGSSEDSRRSPSYRQGPGGRSEARSSAKKDSKKPEDSKEDSTEKPPGPGEELVEGVRKYFDNGRKNIEQAVQKIIPPLPKLRMIRASFNFQMGKRQVDNEGSEMEEAVERHRSKGRSNRHRDDDDMISSMSAFPTEDPPHTEDTKKKNGTEDEDDEDDESPANRFGTNLERVAADAGGQFLHVLNRLTPPPKLRLPTLLPNLEDFGG